MKTAFLYWITGSRVVLTAAHIHGELAGCRKHAETGRALSALSQQPQCARPTDASQSAD
jgi:hypothetical protein